MSLTVSRLSALQVLDSRGNPTLAVDAELSDGSVGVFFVPSGASTGTHESLELRDGAGGGYNGRSVLRAIENVETQLGRELRGFGADDQALLDQRMIEIDGTANKSRLGANAILGVSGAVARAVSISRKVPLWKHLAADRAAVLPLPMINILSGGLHAGGQIDFQDFLILPHGFDSLAQALEATVEVFHATRGLLEAEGFAMTGVADEGGLGPRLPSNEAALDVLARGIEKAGYSLGSQVSIAIDVASSHFFDAGRYFLRSENRRLSANEMTDLLASWLERYPIVSIEDGLAEDDWEGWKHLTERLGGQCRLVGDDFFVTSPERLERGIREGAANAVLVKMNQVGTLTETFEVIDRAREAGYTAVISARSGETEDDFLADLAVASGAGQIKVGSITRSERLAKYNRLLRIEKDRALSGEPGGFQEACRLMAGGPQKS